MKTRCRSTFVDGTSPESPSTDNMKCYVPCSERGQRVLQEHRSRFAVRGVDA
jgi:hypothetical protein